jgi:hypothetical protein
MKRWQQTLMALSLIAATFFAFEPSAQAGYQGFLYYTTSENGSITATAPSGAIFTQVIFASYGNPTGSGPFTVGTCNSSSSVSYVSSQILNKNTYVIYANNTNFGDPCSGVSKNLSITLGYTYIPVNTYVPALSGNPTVGQVLTSDPGTWSYSPNSYSYQWQRATTSGGTYSDISGATNNTYTVSADDVGYYFRMKITATNDAGTTAAVYSSPTGSAAIAAPTTTTLSIAGSPTQGYYRTLIPLVIGTSINGRVTLYANGKVIPGCKNVATVSLTFTCNWKPSIHAPVTLTTNFTPTAAGYLTSKIVPYKILIIARTNNR